MYFSEYEIQKINDVVSGRLVDVIEKFHALNKKSPMLFVCDCPKCNATLKFAVNARKDVFKCFHCNEVAGKGAVSYLMIVEGYSYADALEFLKKELM